MTYHEARDWLRSVQKMRIWVAQNEERLAEIRESLVSGAAYIGEKVRSSPKRSDAVEKMMDMADEIEKEKAELIAKIREVTEAIRSVEQSEILYAKYIDDKTYMQIAEEYHYTYDHVRRLIRLGTKNIAKLKSCPKMSDFGML